MKLFAWYVLALCGSIYGTYELIEWITVHAGKKAFFWLCLPIFLFYLFVKLVSKKYSAIPFLVFWGGIISYVAMIIYAPEVRDFLSLYGYQVAFITVFVLVSYFFTLLSLSLKMIKKRQQEAEEALLRKEAIKQQIGSLVVSDRRNDFYFYDDSFSRNTPREREYRKEHLLTLLKLFNNGCANCGSSKNGLDLDHFIFSKSEGGDFAMHHKGGFIVNNAIPLCQSCNRSKSNMDYRRFFSEARLVKILAVNREMTKIINQ